MLTPREMTALKGITSFPRAGQTALEARAEAIINGLLPASQMPELPPVDPAKNDPEME